MLINQLDKYTVPTPDPLSAILAALADPTRRAILARLSRGEVTVTELAAPFALSLPAISKHLNVLERAGLITRIKRAQWRSCRIQTAPLKQVAAWIDHYRDLWGDSLDGLEGYLQEVQTDAVKGKQ